MINYSCLVVLSFAFVRYSAIACSTFLAVSVLVNGFSLQTSKTEEIIFLNKYKKKT